MRLMMFSLLATLILGSSLANAHGEEHPGPHGGKVKMPGGFHTEAVVISATKVRIYLLDSEFANPTIKDSTVTAEWKAEKSPTTKCKAETDSFLCAFPKEANLTQPGQLHITAKRLGQQGNKVIYPTPLK